MRVHFYLFCLLNFVNNARFIIVNIFISGFMMRHFFVVNGDESRTDKPCQSCQ